MSTYALRKMAWSLYSISPEIRRQRVELDNYLRLDPELQMNHVVSMMRLQLSFFSQFSFSPKEWSAASKVQSQEGLLDAWKHLPIVRKSDLRGRFAPENLRAAGISGKMISSSGSTGEPVSFLHDRTMLSAIRAARMYANIERGWYPGLPMVAVWGSERDLGVNKHPVWRVINSVRGLHLLGAYRLRPQLLDELVDMVEGIPHFALYGFSSMLAYLAQESNRRGDSRLRGRIVSAWNGGEPLTDEAASLFETTFGTELLNHYGSREMGIAFQRPRTRALSVLRPFIFLEVVDQEGKDVTDGSPGRILVSHLVGRGTPFIRYEIGDVGIVHSSDRDLLGLRSITTVSGRTTEVVRLPDGTLIHGIFWAGLARVFPEIESYQVRWNSNHVRLLLVGSKISNDQKNSIESRTREMLRGTSLDVRIVEDIPRTSQGKVLRVVEDSEVGFRL